MPMTRNRARSDRQADIPASDNADNPAQIEDDDLCPICHLLVCYPVTTTCNHTMCNSCMAHWADVSVTMAMTTVDINEALTSSNISPTQIEARCPMCRTQTTADPNSELEGSLRTKYGDAYAAREAEERAGNEDQEGSIIETLTVYIGNEHRLVGSDDEESANKHDWTFFVRPERTDLIEEVHVFLVGLDAQLSVYRTTFVYRDDLKK